MFQASYTGGAPGTPTHSWAFVSNPGPGFAGFHNPVGSSSQKLGYIGPADGITRSFTFRDTITDSLGNVSVSETAEVQFRQITAPPGGPPDP